MNITHTTRQQPKKSWFHTKSQELGVEGYSPAEVIRDTFTQTAIPALTGLIGASIGGVVQGELLPTIGLAAAGVAVGGFSGAWGARAVQELSGQALGVGMTPMNQTNGVAAFAGLTGAVAAAGGIVAASFGATPGQVTLAAAGGALALLGGSHIVSRLDL